MLTLNLEKKWFDKIKAGQKTHEYRDVKPYFASRLTTDLKHNNPVYDIEFVLIKQERVNGASK